MKYALALLSFLVSVPVAVAHISLDPRSAAPGWQRFQVSVPTERDVPTVFIRLVVPDGVVVHGVQPVSGWTHTEKRAAVTTDGMEAHGAETHADRITEIEWSGGKILPGEYQLFGISTQITAASDLVWKAYQTYEGGEVVAWDGADPKLPAPMVTLTASGEDAAPASASDPMTRTLASAALLLALAALVLAMKGRKISAR